MAGLAGLILLTLVVRTRECRRTDEGNSLGNTTEKPASGGLGAFDEELGEALAQFNEGLPLRLDSLTTFDSMTHAGKRIIGQYFTVTVTTEAERAILEAFKRSGAEEESAEHIRTEEELRLLREWGFTFRYTYLAPDGEVVYEYYVTPEMYR